MIKKRLMSVGLLRCFSMFLIVMGHYFNNIASNNSFPVNSCSYFMYQLLTCIDGVSVNIFILISSYFLIDSKFKVKHIVKLWLQVFTYSLLLYLFSIVAGFQEFSVKELIYSATPIFNRRYWFATEYIRFYLIFPFFNLLIRKLTKKQHLYMLVLCVFMNSIYPTLMNMDERLKFLGNWSLWFITLYIIVSYIKLYKVEFRTKTLIQIWLCCTFVMFASKLLIDNITIRVLGAATGADLFIHNNSIFMLGSAISIFMLFMKIEIKNITFEKIIVKISPLTFGVYLFHENLSCKNSLYQLIHNLWQKIGIDNGGYLWVIVGFVSIVLIYVLGCIIDYIRKFLSEHIIERSSIYKSTIEKLQKIIDNMMLE